jgi:hypothetical protein
VKRKSRRDNPGGPRSFASFSFRFSFRRSTVPISAKALRGLPSPAAPLHSCEGCCPSLHSLFGRWPWPYGRWSLSGLCVGAGHGLEQPSCMIQHHARVGVHNARIEHPGPSPVVRTCAKNDRMITGLHSENKFCSDCCLFFFGLSAVSGCSFLLPELGQACQSSRSVPRYCEK